MREDRQLESYQQHTEQGYPREDRDRSYGREMGYTQRSEERRKRPEEIEEGRRKIRREH